MPSEGPNTQASGSQRQPPPRSLAQSWFPSPEPLAFVKVSTPASRPKVDNRKRMLAHYYWLDFTVRRG
jgi:hypothetical protein